GVPRPPDEVLEEHERRELDLEPGLHRPCLGAGVSSGVGVRPTYWSLHDSREKPTMAGPVDYSGVVQGVGLRATAASIVRRLQPVRHPPSGRVYSYFVDGVFNRSIKKSADPLYFSWGWSG